MHALTRILLASVVAAALCTAADEITVAGAVPTFQALPDSGEAVDDGVGQPVPEFSICQWGVPGPCNGTPLPGGAE